MYFVHERQKYFIQYEYSMISLYMLYNEVFYIEQLINNVTEVIISLFANYGADCEAKHIKILCLRQKTLF